ncbi:MAG: peptide-methionine (S)-S-oxide reductase MsrA [Lentisphaerae bacterium]|nr:peptide-methionine (S)-S-oxide reductase MsrA [Lentisphaerota bacterium]
MKVSVLMSFVVALCVGCSAEKRPRENARKETEPPMPVSPEVETVTFGAGCFWCTEAVFERIDGVLSAVSGYMGGTVPNPTYKQICTGMTGHAEVTQVRYDKSRTTFEELLGLFWRMHDPTTLNRQGADVGTQYRSAIFYHSEEQKAAAERSKDAVEKAGEFDRPIVTEIAAASDFYEAEDYHQEYFDNNRGAPYCRFVIQPKLTKLKLEE